jgi:hypothetical protein
LMAGAGWASAAGAREASSAAAAPPMPVSHERRLTDGRLELSFIGRPPS